MGGKLAIGDTLREVASNYWRHARVLLPLAFLLYLPGAIVGGLGNHGVAPFWLGVLVDFAAAGLFNGMVTGLVRDVRAGQDDFAIGPVARSAFPVLLPLLGAGVLTGLAFIAGFALFVFPGLIALTFWAVVAPVIAIERSGVIDAFRRSRGLVRGSGWAVFGAVLIAFVLATASGLALARALNAVADGSLPWVLSSAFASTFTAPVTALVVSVLYFRLLAIEQSAPAGPEPLPAT